jgi:hypothetical protein
MGQTRRASVLNFRIQNAREDEGQGEGNFLIGENIGHCLNEGFKTKRVFAMNTLFENPNCSS